MLLMLNISQKKTVDIFFNRSFIQFRAESELVASAPWSKPMSIRVEIASPTQRVDFGFISNRVELKTLIIDIYSFPA